MRENLPKATTNNHVEPISGEVMGDHLPPVGEESTALTAANAGGLTLSGFSEQQRKKAEKSFQKYLDLIHYDLPENTRKAFENDVNCYQKFCSDCKRAEVTPDVDEAVDTIQYYLKYLIDSGYAKKTINRRLSSVCKLFRLMQCPDPRKTDENLRKHIQLKLNTLKGANQKKPLRYSPISTLPELDHNASNLELRDHVILFLGIYTLARASELLAIHVKHVDFDAGTVFIAKAKNDQEGKGRYANISDRTKSIIKLWVEKAGLVEGDLLIRRVLKSGAIDKPLGYHGLLKITKKLSLQLTGSSDNFGTHSMRIGAAVSLAELGVSLAEITQAGGWKNANMPIHYTQQVNAKKTGTAHFN